MENQPVKILGISCFYHDSAAVLLKDNNITAAAQEERFTRKKHDQSFPINSIEYCLEQSGLSANDVDYVVFYDKPILKLDRLLQTYIKTWPRGLFSFLQFTRSWFSDKLWIEQAIRKKLKYKGEILFTEHHQAHAASSYYSSSFNNAVVITMDGVGEWETITIGCGHRNKLKISHKIDFPHSLGLLYSALTYYLGFRVNSGEYKVMGLAPYGNPEIYYDKIEQLIDVKDDGSFKLIMKYFSYEYGLKMTNRKFNELFGGPPRKPEAELTQKEKDIAAALQKITEEIILKIAKHAKTLHPLENLCLAGGVALNCVANGKILKSGLFKNIYIQPASGDAGGALGAALYVYHDVLGNPKKENPIENVYLGPEYDNENIKEVLDKKSVKYYKFEDQELLHQTARLIAQNNTIGWFQGRMEFGPRALGNRSILADARNKENWQKVNLKIKFRESFRPFAPTILEENISNYFDLDIPSPYMLLVADVKRGDVPAITHINNSARIQSISNKQNPKYHSLIKKFYEITGCPVIINTSFNVRGEPIVESPKDALNCFLNTHMDILVMENYLIKKNENLQLIESLNLKSYLNQFKLD